MSAATGCRVGLVLAAVGMIAACYGEGVSTTGEPAAASPPAERAAFPDPPPEVADQITTLVRQWVAERDGEGDRFDIPPRGGHDVAGVLAEFHGVHQNDGDTYTVCVDFKDGDDVFDVDFFVDRVPEGLRVRDVFLHKINGDVVSG